VRRDVGEARARQFHCIVATRRRAAKSRVAAQAEEERGIGRANKEGPPVSEKENGAR